MAEGRESAQSSSWSWFLGGCLVAAVVLAMGAAVIFYAGYRWASGVGEAQKEPARRTARACEILGCERLPEGYHSMAALSIPFLADVAVLTDREPNADGVLRDFGPRGLIFVRSIRFGGSKTDLEDYFAGKTQDAEVLHRSHINIRAEEIVKRGVIEGSPKLLYLVERGSLHFESGRTHGLLTLIVVDCAKTEKLVLAIWFGPDPSPGVKLDDAALAGTTGDEKVIAEFMGRFHPCPR